MKKEPKTKPKQRTENQIRQDEFLASLSDVQRTELLEVLNKLFEAADLPPSRRGNYFGNRFAKIAAHERCEHTGFEETMRILDIYVSAVRRGEPYRPTFTTPTILLTTGWQKMIAFTDSYTKKNKGAIKIGDSALRDEIAKGLAQS